MMRVYSLLQDPIDKHPKLKKLGVRELPDTHEKLSELLSFSPRMLVDIPYKQQEKIIAEYVDTIIEQCVHSVMCREASVSASCWGFEVGMNVDFPFKLYNKKKLREKMGFVIEPDLFISQELGDTIYRKGAMIFYPVGDRKSSEVAEGSTVIKTQEIEYLGVTRTRTR